MTLDTLLTFIDFFSTLVYYVTTSTVIFFSPSFFGSSLIGGDFLYQILYITEGKQSSIDDMSGDLDIRRPSFVDIHLANLSYIFT